MIITFGIFYNKYLLYIGRTRQYDIKTRFKQIKKTKKDRNINLTLLFDYFNENDLMIEILYSEKQITKIKFMKYKKYKLRYKLYNNFLNSIRE